MENYKWRCLGNATLMKHRRLDAPVEVWTWNKANFTYEHRNVKKIAFGNKEHTTE